MTESQFTDMNKGFPSARIELDQLHLGAVEGGGALVAESGAWGIEDARLLDRPRLEFKAEAAGSGGVRVTGVLRASLGLTCRRCLRDLERAVEIDLDFRFDPAVQPWDEEDGVYGLDPEAAILDLSDPLRQELVLAVPEYPECPDGCVGLCPVCGVDLDETECGCSRVEPDPRWDVLRKLAVDGRGGPTQPDVETNG